MKALLFTLCLSPFCASCQWWTADAPEAPKSDTTHGLGVLLYETTLTQMLPGGGMAENKFVRVEPLRCYMVRRGDTLTLHRATGEEIPLNDLMHFKPDEKK